MIRSHTQIVRSHWWDPGYAIYLYNNHKGEDSVPESLPTIYMPGQLGISIAFLGGPWMGWKHQDKLLEYNFSIEYPLQVLKDAKRKESIARNIGILSSTSYKLFGNDPKDIEKDLDSILELKDRGHMMYKRWSQKINGKTRNLAVPNEPLDHFLRAYVKDIILSIDTHPKAHGGEKNWSTIKSLSEHVPFTKVLTIDIKDAFEIMESTYVFDFYYDLALHKIQDQDEARDCAGFLTFASTVYSMNCCENILPQGSPISMALFNRILKPMDVVFEKQCQKKGYTYSRWVDDIIISSNDNRKPENTMWDMIKVVCKARANYRIPAHKAFFQDKEPFYVLGQSVSNSGIVKANEALKGARKKVDESRFFTEFEWRMNGDSCGAYWPGRDVFTEGKNP